MSWDLQDFEGYGGMSDLTKNFESASALAAKKGYRVDLPGPKELFVDIDDAAGLRRFKEGFLRLDAGEEKATIFFEKP